MEKDGALGPPFYPLIFRDFSATFQYKKNLELKKKMEESEQEESRKSVSALKG